MSENGNSYVVKNRKECRRMSVAKCLKYYHLSTKDPRIIDCDQMLIPGVRNVNAQSEALVVTVQLFA